MHPQPSRIGGHYHSLHLFLKVPQHGVTHSSSLISGPLLLSKDASWRTSTHRNKLGRWSWGGSERHICCGLSQGLKWGFIIWDQAFSQDLISLGGLGRANLADTVVWLRESGSDYWELIQRLPSLLGARVRSHLEQWELWGRLVCLTHLPIHVQPCPHCMLVLRQTFNKWLLEWMKIQ